MGKRQWGSIRSEPKEARRRRWRARGEDPTKAQEVRKMVKDVTCMNVCECSGEIDCDGEECDGKRGEVRREVWEAAADVSCCWSTAGLAAVIPTAVVTQSRRDCEHLLTSHQLCSRELRLSSNSPSSDLVPPLSFSQPLPHASDKDPSATPTAPRAHHPPHCSRSARLGTRFATPRSPPRGRRGCSKR